MDGKKNGKGKEYDKDGNLIYEGGYLNGKRNGTGKENDKEHGIIFNGEFLNGKRWNGKGLQENLISFELKDGKGEIK